MKNSAPTFLIILVLLSAFGSFSARAVTEVDQSTSGNSGAYDPDILTNDLLKGATLTGVYTVSAGTNPATGTAIHAGDPVTKSDNGFTLSGFNDGSANDFVPSNATVLLGGGQLGTSILGAPQFTFALNTTGANSLGYDLTKITTIYGYSGYSQILANQSYTVSYSTLLAPLTFVPLKTVSYTPFSDTDNGGESSQVDLTNLTGAVYVSSIRFTFTDVPDQAGLTRDAQLIRELDVTGTAMTVAAPEPSTYALLLASLAFLGLTVRRKTAPAAR